MFSKMSGIPFNPHLLSHNPTISAFFPGAVTLTDILSRNGYEQRFIFGSDKAFASRGVFLESHGNVAVHDIGWYKRQGLLPKNYEVFWGFEDEKLYDFARQELSELAATDSPFFFGMLTVDTHSPDGYSCGLCARRYPDAPIKDAISCADRQIGEFMGWLERQDFYGNTTVAILGDHLFMTTKSTGLFSAEEDSSIDYNDTGEVMTTAVTGRRWIDIFVNSAVAPGKEKNRIFSSFDIFPSILEAMGATVEGHALGFGRSLFSGCPTLLEKYDADHINRETMRNTTQYLDLLYGKSHGQAVPRAHTTRTQSSP